MAVSSSLDTKRKDVQNVRAVSARDQYANETTVRSAAARRTNETKNETVLKVRHAK